MHIPSKPTKEYKNIAFKQALLRANRENDEYDVRKWLYIPHTYTDYRYILGTRGKNPLICIGINPSTARPDGLDNTLKSVERIALGNGFDSFIMLNVYPQRATNPDNMEKELNAALHRENLEAFSYALSLCKQGKPSVWAAWGTIIEKRGYLFSCDMVKLSNKYGVRWFCAGAKTKKGHPHHPLYLKKDSLLDGFDIENYCQIF